jgi:Uri superfamily endonuclease
MKPVPGTYALIPRCRSRTEVQVGRLRRIDLVPGYYVYVGSAFGPGGVKARVSRHLRGTKRRHWHIDYIYEFTNPVEVWYSYDSKHLEHRWARILSGMSGISSVHGFGCSDCRCDSHLFHTSVEPDFDLFCKIAGGMVEAHIHKIAGGTIEKWKLGVANKY